MVGVIVGGWGRAQAAHGTHLLSLKHIGEKDFDLAQRVGGLAVEGRVESSL